MKTLYYLSFVLSPLCLISCGFDNPDTPSYAGEELSVIPEISSAEAVYATPPIEEVGDPIPEPVSVEPEFYNNISEIPVPNGFERVVLEDGSFGSYLRHFPIRPIDTVFLYDGRPKWNQRVHHAVLELEIGKRDLQQCADVVMHLRAEYLWEKKKYSDISFLFASGKTSKYNTYVGSDKSYKRFLKYLNHVYNWANTGSLRKQMQPIDAKDMQVGDVFVQAGRPYGHAMIVVDMAENAATGKKVFLLAQGYIPAQDAEVVVNPNSSALSPWYDCEIGNILNTPEWTFYREDLRRFK